MTSKQLVIETMKGNNTGITPRYAWVEVNLKDEISEKFGSVANFEDHYELDMAHIFGCPYPFNHEIRKLKESGVEITPEIMLDFPLNDISDMASYQGVIKSLEHHRQRDRFCYVQTDGIFENFSREFGIENHLMDLLLYEDELQELYERQVKWNIKNAQNLLDLHVDGIHVSDDWGSQKSMLFSPSLHQEMIVPHHKKMVEEYKKMSSDVLVSLHSDGCVAPALDSIVDIGYDFIHPWQENCGMPYSLYLDKYQDKFGILGGVCVQSTLGFGDLDRVKSEIERVYATLKGKRWVCCTTHYVQNSCSMEELIFAMDLMKELGNKK